MKKPLPIALKLAVSLGLIILIIRNIDLTQAWAILQKTNPLIFICALILFVLTVYCHSYRWGLLLDYHGIKATQWTLFRLNMAAAMHSTLLPGGQVTAETIKCYRITRGMEKKKEIVVSVFFDKFLGVFSMNLVGLLLLILSPTAILQRGQLTLLLALPFLLGLLVLISLWRGWLGQLLQSLKLKFLQSLEEVAFYYHHAGRLLLKTTSLSFLFHFIYTSAFYLLCRSLQIELLFFDSAWLFVAISIVMFIPLSIMGFGLREGSLVVFGGLIGLAEPSCLALALLLFVASLSLSLLGWLFDLTLLTTDHRPTV